MLAKETLPPRPPARPKLLFVQTQAIAAGAQEISRLLHEGLAKRRRDGEPEYEIHHLFFYRISDAFDRMENVHFVQPDAPRSPLAILRFMARLTRMVRAIGPDVMLTFQHYGNVFGAPAARLARVPAVIANHVSAPATIGALTRRIDRALGSAGFYDVITVNSRETWRDYQAYPERYRRLLAYVPHGFEDKTVTAGKAEARAAFGLPADAKLIGSVARLHPLKQLDAALRVLAKRPQLHLALAGQGQDEPRLRSLAAELGVADRVHLVGDTPPSRIGLFLAGLDVFVFPSLAETFGLAAVEAAQAGIPVVANDLPVLREVLQVDGEPCALFAVAADTDAFAAQIDRVLADPALAADLVARGRRLGQLYSLDAMVDAYAGLIAQALAGRTAKAAEGRTAALAPAPSRRA